MLYALCESVDVVLALLVQKSSLPTSSLKLPLLSSSEHMHIAREEMMAQHHCHCLVSSEIKMTVEVRVRQMCDLTVLIAAGVTGYVFLFFLFEV
jgi:hypothetical protein